MSRAHPTDVAADERLRVDLDVDPSAEFTCPITDVDGDVNDVRVNAVGDDCNVDIQPSGEGTGVVRASGSVDDDCLCSIFQDFDTVPHIRGVENDTMLVTAYVDDRTSVRGLIEDLRGIADSVRLVRLTVVDGPDARKQVTFDLSALTTKQREALELAVVRGYFDGDSDTSLGELADELGISKSALSQRIRTAQSKLVTEVFEDGP